MTTSPPTTPLPDKGHAPIDTLAYPFPIRPGVTVSLINIPADMTRAEADRIAAFIRALAIPEKESS